jgi:preprotein translocase subunit SecG
MALFETILFVVQILVAITLCGLILLQHGKGADMGAAFGSGSSGSLFGAAGSANFLSRTTAILAAVFFLSSLGLTYLGTTHARKGVTQQGVMQDAPATKSAEGNASSSAPTSTPATPTVPAPASTPSAPSSKAADIPK